jgi:hypothetical protein
MMLTGMMFEGRMVVKMRSSNVMFVQCPLMLSVK